jgi:uncharacterized protein (DUF885 family)
MKRLFKALFKLLLAAVVLLAVVAVHLVWFRPFDIDLFFERVFIEYALDDPELLTTLRLLEPLGIESHNVKLTDASPRRQLALQDKLKDDLATLQAYDRDDLSDGQKLSHDILEYFLAMAVEGQPWDFHNYPVNSLSGVQNELPAFMAADHRVTSKSQARDYIARLEKFPEKFEQVQEGLVYRQKRGILPPRFVIEKVLDGMRSFVRTPARENVLYLSLKTKLDALDREDMDPVTQKRMLNRVENAIEDFVHPAYGDLIKYFEKLQDHVQQNHGAWNLPRGDEFYAFKVRLHTTTELSPDQVHQIGLEEVSRIEQEMDALLIEQGLTQGSVGARMAALCRDPKHQYPDDARSGRQILADYQEIVDQIDQGLEPWFDRRPAGGVEVVRVPRFKQDNATIAYYRSPSLDGTRPGRFFVNLRDVPAICKPGMRTLAYHEAIPGHHFQIALMQELTDVPTFRRIIPFTAFTEGWALYAEQLAWEAGFQDDPLDNLGRLQGEMFRAARLVIDTGLHQMKWTREQGIDYLTDKTGYSETDATAEVERYLINPGQALAYKIGMLKILELRERARQALGDGFEIGQFHNVVLGQGGMPLSLLESQVDAWIAASQ